jgi:thiamine biosynthesis protein ThiS
MSERPRRRSNFNYNEAQKNVSNQRQGGVISIIINGERQEVPAGLNIRNLVSHIGLDPERVAVELNRRLVRRADWESTPVEEGASLEIVTFVGGG